MTVKHVVAQHITGIGRRVANWLDDHWQWHKLCGHTVRTGVVDEMSAFRYWAHVCEDCDYTWIR